MTFDEHPEMLYRPLGRTGEKVSAIGVGGFHLALSGSDESLAVRIVREAVDRGITFMDNCWDYNDGASELRMGKALRDGYRDKVFLMTKIDGRSKKEAASAARRVPSPPPDRPHRPRAAPRGHPLRGPAPHLRTRRARNEALLEAREAGKLRYIGFTGHKDPHIHLHMLDVAAEHGFRFDAVQMPLNVMDAHYRSFEQHGAAAPGRGGHRRARHEEHGRRASSSESGVVTPIECLHYALNLPTSVVITGIDSLEILDQALEAVRTFRPLGEEQVERRCWRGRRRWPRRASSSRSRRRRSSTAPPQNPEWLGDEPDVRGGAAAS